MARFLDHTLLKPDATVRDIEQLVADALTWNTYAVCVNSAYVPLVSQLRGHHTDLHIASTVGFPLGQALTACKVAETEEAIAAGADEIDLVWNLGFFLSGRHKEVEKDIQAVVNAAKAIPVKVILETGRLSPEQMRTGAQLAVGAGAKTVKTSTGFGFGGATVEAVRILREAVGPDIGVKASGGVSTYNDALLMIAAGATRIGLSKTGQVLAEAPAQQS
nr:deoxyribose-phosphate aldolase [Sulfobacillus harzensis]